MTLVSTPADRFQNLPAYDYEAHFVDVGGPEMAYVDVDGPASDDDGRDTDVETFLCLHGEPTWGFLYRTMIPTLSSVGRVVVPDFVGFGRSDKYTEPGHYTYELHYESLVTFIETLDLTNVTLICQDWGGILGLPVAANNPARFARLVPMNTDVPTGDQEMADLWYQFRDFVEGVDELPVSTIVQNATATELSDAELAAYDAPFHSEAAKAAARAWPDMVPRADGGDGAEITSTARETLREWDDPAFVLFSDSDPITRGARDPLRELLPTASEQPDVWAEGAMHFLQEDAGDWLAEQIVAFVERT